MNQTGEELNTGNNSVTLVQSRYQGRAPSVALKTAFTANSPSSVWISEMICTELYMQNGVGTVSPETGVGWVGEYLHLQTVPEIFLLHWNIFFPCSPKKRKAGRSLWAVPHTHTTESNRGTKSTRHGPDLHLKYFTNSRLFVAA